LAAHLRKHSAALITLAAFHFAFFFPVIFMGRVVSPNDVFYNYQPWGTFRPASIVRVQNNVLNDPATAYLPLMSLVKNGWGAFQWNPYVGGGIPGFGSSAAAVLSPFVFFPALVVPMPWVYTAMLLLKLNVAFLFAYAWLREERLGKRGAAIGAIVIAASGVYTARWLWQITNATALYPALLWVVRRTVSGKRTSIAIVALIVLSYALAGFPAAMAYGAYINIAYALFLTIRERRLPQTAVARSAIGAILGLLVAAPSVVPFVQFLRRSGYLEIRRGAAAMTYPLHHWRAFIDPFRIGNPAEKNWLGDQALPINNFIEAAIYAGVITIGLAALAIISKGKRGKWFWIGAAIAILAVIFGLAPFAGLLPGLKYSALERVVLLLPLPAGFLAASGAAFLIRHLRRLATFAALALGIVVAGDLATFAGAFYPYLKPADTEVPSTPVIRFLQNDPKPFRFAGLLTYMWPNSAELYRIEDIASHFGSEAAYRRLLHRIDPTSWSGTSTVIQFNSLKFNFRDPLVSMLGVRYFLEHRTIDIVKWTIFGATVPGVKESGAMRVMPGQLVQRSVPVDAEPFWSIELPVSVEQAFGPSPSLRVELWKGGRLAWARVFAESDVSAIEKIYVPLHGIARIGETVTVRVRPQGMIVRMLKGPAAPNETPMYYGRVTIPLIFDRQLPDGRIFRNLAEVPRFHAVRRVRKLNADEFLAATGIDLGDEAVITDDPVFPPASIDGNAIVNLVHYEPAEQRVRTESTGPMFLASSEKLTPELRITIDGRDARAIQINTLFAGANVPAGRHEVVFTRRIGRGWWPAAILAAMAIAAIGLVDAISLARRRSAASAASSAR
jgi:hypothetical protein